jgi:predicted nucleotidyltransferase
MGPKADNGRDFISPLAAALFGKTRQAVLALLFEDPDRRFYVRQVVRLAGGGHGAVQRELASLVKSGILNRSTEGHQVYYGVNRDCPIFEELRGLLLKTAGAAAVLRESLAALAERITVAFVYGSVAAGRETAASDIDVMVIGEVSFGEVVEALRRPHAMLAREVNPTVYPPAEFRRKLKQGHHFVGTVAGGPKVFLIGSESDLTRLVEGGLASA